MRYSMPVKTWERTPGHRLGADLVKQGPTRKNVIVQIIRPNQENEIHEFDSAKECADFLGLTTEQVQIMGDEHLTLKRKKQKIRVICDELTEIRMVESKKKSTQSFPYRSDEKTIWVPLKESLFGYVEISNQGALRKKSASGNTQRKTWVNVNGEQIYKFKPFSGRSFITIKAELLFNQYVKAFDEAFKARREQRINEKSKKKEQSGTKNSKHDKKSANA